jgi:DNA-binding LytR/AlgR family response regulator
MSEKSVTALIVDDEAPMRAQLRARLHEVWPALQIVAEAANGVEAVDDGQAACSPISFFSTSACPAKAESRRRAICTSQYHIVFVTAYDQYALDAFEQGAMDYLLKPVTAERLRLTCERLRQRLTKAPQNIGDQLQQLARLLEQGGEKKPEYLRWIQAQVGNSLRMISTKEVLFFRSDEKYTVVQTAQAEMLIRKTLKELADELDPKEFWRIHRSTLVRVDAIAEVTRDERGRQMLKVRNSAAQLEVSRNHAHLFQQM